jgi:hypothetical protein
MMYTTEMSSSAKVYIPSFINMCSGIQKLMGGGDTDICKPTPNFELYLSMYAAYS